MNSAHSSEGRGFFRLHHSGPTSGCAGGSGQLADAKAPDQGLYLQEEAEQWGRAPGHKQRREFEVINRGFNLSSSSRLKSDKGGANGAGAGSPWHLLRGPCHKNISSPVWARFECVVCSLSAGPDGHDLKGSGFSLKPDSKYVYNC